jgi:hypothetical protein
MKLHFVWLKWSISIPLPACNSFRIDFLRLCFPPDRKQLAAAFFHGFRLHSPRILLQLLVHKGFTIIHSFIHLAVCLATGLKLLPKPALHTVRSRAFSFRREHPFLSLALCLLMSYIHGAPCEARNVNVVYIWTYVWQRWKPSLSICCKMFQHRINAESYPVAQLCVNTLLTT